MMMSRRCWPIAAILLVLLGAVGAYWLDLIPLHEIEDGDYGLRPVSVFVGDRRSDIQYLARGQQAWWQSEPGRHVVWVSKETNWRTVPYAEVAAYPELSSERPLTIPTCSVGRSRSSFRNMRNTPGIPALPRRYKKPKTIQAASPSPFAAANSCRGTRRPSIARTTRRLHAGTAIGSTTILRARRTPEKEG